MAPVRPYDILGVSSNATQGDIKRAYYKLALQEHPDRSTRPSGAVMSEINNAYELIGTSQKRAMFDNAAYLDWGGVDLHNYRETGGGNILKKYFNLVSEGMDTEITKTPLMKVAVFCPLDNLHEGVEITVEYSRTILVQSVYNRILQKRLKCGNCSGTGYVIERTANSEAKKQCTLCNGVETVECTSQKTTELTIQVPTGSAERHEITIEYLGNEVENRDPGDVMFIFYTDKAHPPDLSPVDQTVNAKSEENSSWLQRLCSLL